jgi:hypothetical protein
MIYTKYGKQLRIYKNMGKKMKKLPMFHCNEKILPI